MSRSNESQSNEFRPDRFISRWRIISGSIPEAKFHAVISSVDGGFLLDYEENGVRRGYNQVLKFNEATKTLESAGGGGKTARCLAFWNRQGQPPCIFAMRRRVAEPVALLPWELADDDGTWGAEEEPPPSA
jgi:hypothetical protein